MSNLTILDVDSIVFTVAYRYRKSKSDKMVKMSVNKFISDVLKNSDADDYIGFYGSKEDGAKPNFRYDVFDKYKANRPETPDYVKKWMPVIHKIFKDDWGFFPTDGMEADDAASIAAAELRANYTQITIATFDKDLKQIPNTIFYDMRKHEKLVITAFDASSNLCTQMLTGDTTDNIPGLPGIGPVKAKTILGDASTERVLWYRVVKAYADAFITAKDKAKTTIIEDIKNSLEGLAINAYPEAYKNLSGVRLERKIRINSTTQIADHMKNVMGGCWKTYFKQQIQLLGMLTESPDWFTLPAVQESPVKKLQLDAAIVVKAVTKDEVDDFLTI